MKKLLIIVACVSLYSIIQLVTGCADPLDNGLSGPVSPTNPQTDTLVILDSNIVADTSVIIDTVFITDTVSVVDSVFIVDTTLIVDTVTHSDTVIIVVPDTNSAQLCSRIGSTNHDIVWLLQNKAGEYHLEFAALAERGKPKQTVIVNIDGRQLEWSPAEQPELVVDQFLSEKAIIRISLSNPGACGHSIDICLLMSRRK